MSKPLGPYTPAVRAGDTLTVDAVDDSLRKVSGIARLIAAEGDDHYVGLESGERIVDARRAAARGECGKHHQPIARERDDRAFVGAGV